MIINESLKNILATGDENKVNEVVGLSLEKHKNYEIASKEPGQWCIWADVNPRDSLRLMNQWVEEGKDVSMFTNFKPDLTPCETFANALGYAKHLKLKEFLFRNYGSYTYAMHTYSTTKLRNKGTSNAPVGQSDVSHSKAYDNYTSRFNDSPKGTTDIATPPVAPSTDIATPPVKPPVTPRSVPGKNDNMALRRINRSDPRFNGVRLDNEFANLNEVKNFIKETMLKEIKKA